MAEVSESPKLCGFGVANYRSFDEGGFIIRDPKKINVFIGKNNCGKSNVLRALAFISRLHGTNDGRRAFVHATDAYRQRDAHVTVTGHVELRPFLAERKVQPRNIEHSVTLVGERLEVCWDTFTGEFVRCEQLSSLDLRELHRLMAQWTGREFNGLQPSHEPYLAALAPLLMHAALANLHAAFKGMLTIPVFREIRDVSGSPPDGVFNGQNIIETLRDMQSPDTGHDPKRDVFDAIQDFTRDLLGTPDLRLEVPAKKNVLNVLLHGLPRLPLDNFGTGVHHLVLLCAALAMNKDKVVTIEEPEVHLNPDLQRKFLHFIAEKTANTYYITTHSNVFLDARRDVNVYHVRYDGTKSLSPTSTLRHGRGRC
jgi:predicted ATPase